METMEEKKMGAVEDLGIKPSQIQVNLKENTFTAVVHEKWLNYIQTKGALPGTEVNIPKWTNKSQSSIFGKIPRPWQKITLTCIIKPSQGDFSLPKIEESRVIREGSSFMQFMGAIAKDVYSTEWEQAYHHYPSTLNKYHHSLSKQVHRTDVVELIHHLYNCPVIYLNGNPPLGMSRTSTKSLNIPNSSEQVSSQHSNLVPAYCAIVASERLYLLQPHHEHTVQDVSMFSPAMLSGSYSKPLFVMYQMLEAVAQCHRRGVSSGNVSLSDFVIDENLWVRFSGPRFNDLFSFCKTDHSNLKTSSTSKSVAISDDIPCTTRTGIVGKNNESCAIDDDCDSVRTIEALPKVMQKWVMGEISNYDYLMILNRLANRQMGNPNHHPIMPWVMDFSRPEGGFRDFSKSKYRLNKGDKQLEFTYESALQMQALGEEQDGRQAHFPHHISDVLSEITYYIYKARCTPKSILQAHVRSVWVPNEYPASIQRLQSWTPDECIPEFFSDPSIFGSMHEDLPDLGVPPWCSGPQDFVEKHREVLESQYVSERLHRWIDLTFGYKLSGSAAVKAKNVVLCLVDQHTVPANNGVVQLFNVAHPKRFSPSPYVSLQPPSVARSQVKADSASTVSTATQEEEPVRAEQDASSAVEGGEVLEPDRAAGQQSKESLTTSVESERSVEVTESSGDSSAMRNRSQSFNNEAQSLSSTSSLATDDSQFSKNPIRKLPFFRPKSDMPHDSRQIRPELATIVLPEDYDPLSALNQLESLHSFTAKASYDRPTQHHVEDKDVRWQQLVARDVLVLGCLFTELCLASKLRSVQRDDDLDNRWQNLQRVVRIEYQEIPRPIREMIYAIFKTNNSHQVQSSKPWDLTDFYQTSHSGLSPLTPSVLLQSYSGIVAFPGYFGSLYKLLSELHDLRFQASDEDPHQTDLTDLKAMNMVQLARQLLPKITADITAEGRELLMPYMRNLFEESSTAVYAALSLFNKYSASLGPKVATKELLISLVRLFESEFSSPDYLLLFQHSFLSQVILCLGLKPFLFSLIKFVTEATNGLKHCPTFAEGSGEQGSGLSAAKGGIQETESFLEVTEDISVEEELFGSDNGDTGDLDDDATEDSATEDANQQADSSGSNGKDNSEDEDDVSEAVAALKLDNQADKDSLGERVSLNDSETSETSGDREQDTASIHSGNLPSLTEEAEENDETSEDIPSTNDSSAFARRQSTKEDDPVVKNNQTKSSDQFRVEKQQLSTKLYQVSTLIGKSLSEVSSESVMWLVQRIGPALTASYITPKLLEALCDCYSTPQQLVYCYINDDQDFDQIDTSGICIGKKTVAGDVNAKPVLKCLTDIALLYGDQFIFQQYLPFIRETVRRVQKKVSGKLEVRLISSVLLLRHILPHLTDSSLMKELQHMSNKLIRPLLDIMSCTNIVFPSGGVVRTVVCFKLVDIINAIALRIGREMTRLHMTDILKRFFLCFKLASPNLGGTAMSNIDYNNRKASLAYSTDSEDKYCVIELDNETNQLCFGSPVGPHSRQQSVDSTHDTSPTPFTGGITRPGSLGSLSEESACLEDMRGVLQEVFTPELAHAAYIPLCRLTGSIHMENILDNHDQIWALSSQHEEAMSTQQLPQVQSPLSDDGSLLNSSGSLHDDRSWSASCTLADSNIDGVAGGRSTFGGNMTVVGNRIGPAFGEDEPPTPRESSGTEGQKASEGGDVKEDAPSSPRIEMNKSKRTLKGAWLSYWTDYLGRDEQDNSFHFQQIKLQTFTGHTSGVKALCVMPNENTFLSASRDKTVKIWSLRNYGDGSAKSNSQLSYGHHRKTVFDVRLLESQRLVASCDGNVHVWDPINGAAVRGYDLSRNTPSCMEVMPAPSPCVLVATDTTIRFIDTRHGGVQQEITAASGPLGLIRCIAASLDGHTLGVGLSSGVVSMVDLRMGLLLGGWRAHEGEILQIKAHSNRTFLTSSVDHSVTLWKEDGNKVCPFRGASEPVHCVCLSDDQVLSATYGNRIGIHTAINAQANYSSWKLRSDSFKGAINALAVLPLSKLLLIASDNGSVFLLA